MIQYSGFVLISQTPRMDLAAQDDGDDNNDDDDDDDDEDDVGPKMMVLVMLGTRW